LIFFGRPLVRQLCSLRYRAAIRVFLRYSYFLVLLRVEDARPLVELVIFDLL